MEDASALVGQRLWALVEQLTPAERELIELRFGLLDGVARDAAAIAHAMKIEQADVETLAGQAFRTLRAYEFSLRWEIEDALGSPDEGAQPDTRRGLREALAVSESTKRHAGGWWALLTEVFPDVLDWVSEPGAASGAIRMPPFTRTLLGVWHALPAYHRRAMSIRYGLATGTPRLNEKVGYVVDGRVAWIWELDSEFARIAAAYDAACRWALEATLGPADAMTVGDRAALVRLLSAQSETAAHPERWLDLFASVCPAVADRVGAVSRSAIAPPPNWALGEPLVVELFHMLLGLSERERQVLVLRYGLDGADSPDEKTTGSDNARKPRKRRNRRAGGTAFRTLEQVGNALEVTRERIRQIEKKALRKIEHPRRLRVVRRAVERQLSLHDLTTRDYAHGDLVKALNRWPDVFPHPERWLALLATILPDVKALQPIEVATADARQHLEALLRERDGSVDRSEFEDYLRERGCSSAEAYGAWSILRGMNLGYFWTDDSVLVPRYIEIARFVLRADGEPLHWRDIADRAQALGLDRDISVGTLYNAITANPEIFVYRGPGTYGLREWGLERRRYQTEVIVDWFRRAGRNAQSGEIVAALRGTEDEIGLPSVSWYLHANALFFEDIDGNYGLREWLPPTNEQRLDTPRHLRESKRSREQRGSESGR